MEHDILLKTYTKNLYLKLFPEHDISNHRERDWINKLQALFHLCTFDTEYYYNSTLCILSLLTACFMEKHQLHNNIYSSFADTQTRILTKMTDYNYETSFINGVNIKLSANEINYFFSFYMHYANIWETFEYESEEEKKEILDYRKKYIDTYNLWSMTRQSEGSMNRFNNDIPNFVQALYHREQLPNAQKYYDTGDIPDDIVEQLTSFKIIDGELQ